MLNKLKEQRGEFLLDSAFKVLIGAAILAFGISIFGSVAQANRLAAMANDLTRYIELRGDVNNSDINSELARLSGVAGLDGVMARVDAACTAGGTRIQFGDSFTVTLRYTGRFGIGGVVSMPLPFETSVVGRSERYWK